MKNVLNIANFVFVMFFALATNVAFSANAGSTTTNLIGGDVVAVWAEQDNFGNSVVKGATGTVAAPGSWTITTISDPVSATNNNPPRLFANAAGDVVVLWEYVDVTTSNAFLAAAMLPFGASTWNVSTVSTSSEYAGLFDQFASVDSSGNIIATWSAYDLTFTSEFTRGATATMGTSTSWNTPFTIAP